MMDMGFGFPFLLSQMMFYVIPVLMFVIIGLAIFRSLKEWHRNENSPG